MADLCAQHPGAAVAGARLAELAACYGIPFPRALAPPPPRTFATSGGLNLAYLYWGGDGEPLLFLHGGSLTAHTWDLVCLSLCERFRCVAMDLRGHGGSAWADDYSIDAHVADVAALISHLGWPAVHIVGMSLGGTVAAHYAATPASRAVSLAMVDVAPGVDFDSTLAMRSFMRQPIDHLDLEALVDLAVKASARGGREKIYYRYLHLTRRDEQGRLAFRADRRKQPNFTHILEKVAELRRIAPLIKAQALVVRGELSRVLSEDCAVNFAERFPNGQFRTVADAGHNVQEDNPRGLAEALAGFLCG